ncbi:MAG TPA: site-specific integrase [Blastocatellia bacterium]|nr:site-specific integrase [Blastocatellia bacterium]
MATFKRGKIYYYNFWWEGEHIQRSTKQGNPRVARQMEAAHKTALAKGEAGIFDRRPIPHFAKAMEAFLEWSAHEHKAHPNTYRRYIVSSKALLRYFKDKKLDQITPEDVESYKTWRAGQKNFRSRKALKPATTNRELACLKAMFNFHIKGDLMLKNPVRSVKFFNEDNEQMRTLTFDEQRTYLATTSQPLRDAATLMLETGMRPEEVYRIRVDSINLDGAYLFNPYGKTKAAKRKVPLNKIALEIITRRMNEVESPYLFPSPSNPQKPVLKLNNAHYGALRRSGLKAFRLYDLRHTWATRAAMSGIDLVTLAAMLGHSRIQMVLRYAHPTEQHQAEAARRLEEFNTVMAISEIEKRQSATTMHAPTTVSTTVVN